MVVIKDAKVFTVAGPVLDRASVLIRDGRIVEAGATVSEPPGAEVVDARGLSLYPGLFDADTILGMEGARENTMGEFLPHLKAFWSFRTEADLIELARANGVTHVVARPGRSGPGGRLRRGLLPGQAAVVSLLGETPEKIEITRDGPIIVNFPSVGGLEYTGDERFAVPSWSATKKSYDRDVQSLRRFFREARGYRAARQASSEAERRATAPDLAFEAMIPVLDGKRVVYLPADTDVDIKAAVEFAKSEKLNFAIEGAEEAWKVLDFLKQQNVRVVYEATYAVPAGEDEPIDIVARTPALLHEKGIPFALCGFGNAGSDSRHLPYLAGSAVAYGLPYDAALRAVTLTPAEFLGLHDQLGSVEKGKRANLVLADGDIFEPKTRIRRVFIDGRSVGLETIQTRLYEKYRPRR